MSLDLLKHVRAVKQELDRTLECKHTAFDDLYPYMAEHQQFFWYKRHAAWAAMLAVLAIAEEAKVEWRSLFTQDQVRMIESKVLDKKVLDEWIGLTAMKSDAD